MGILKATIDRVLPGKRREPFLLKHVAIIMDGNRRWADKKRLPRLLGHRQGVKTLKELVRYAGSSTLKYLTVYAFSSENWSRSKQEVDYLMALLAEAIKVELPELHANNVRLRFIGDLRQMPDNLAAEFARATEQTRQNTGLSLQVAVNYGSRLEIIEAIKNIAADVHSGAIEPANIDETLVSSYLYTKDVPDPDLLIRTGGDMRLSNYLLWQCAYTEFYVTPVLWPEFTAAHFEEAIAEFASRRRRFGGD